MNPGSTYLLSKLARLAKSHEEDFLTEVVVFYLNHIKEHDQIAAVTLINNITNNILALQVSELASLQITTQHTIEKGVPDIRIENGRWLIYLEVKVKAKFGYKQLEKYRKALNLSEKETALVTLTKRPFYLMGEHTPVEYSFRWIQFSDWVAELIVSDAIGEYLKAEVLRLLTDRGLTMNHIDRHFISGIPALQNLAMMLREAATSVGVSITQNTGAWTWYGIYIQKSKFFFGIYHSAPNKICFNTEQTHPDLASKVVEPGYVEGAKWFYTKDLTADDCDFFSLSKTAQLEYLEDFLQTALEAWGRIESL